MNSDIHHVDTPILPQLEQDEIHLWCCDDTQVKDASLIHHYRAWLDDVELDRLGRFYFAEHRHQFLVARALVRFALSTYHSSIGPADWRFGSNDYGRPTIVNRELVASDLVFNLSHTRGLIVLAFCHGGELGVDVEHCDKSCDNTLLSDQFFSPVEAAALRALPISQQRFRTLDHWTLKEAYIKARGMGLAIPLDSFSFDLSSPGGIDFSVETEAGDRADGWQFWQVEPDSAHKIAVAHRAGDTPSTIKLRFFEAVPHASVKPVNRTVISSTMKPAG